MLLEPSGNQRLAYYGRELWRTIGPWLKGLLLVLALWLLFSGISGNQRAAERQRRHATVRGLWQNFAIAYNDATERDSEGHIKGFAVIQHAGAFVPPNVVSEARQRWRAFMQHAPTFEQHASAFTRDRAIVISGGGYQLEFVFASVKLLRSYGCTLPVELWVSSVRNEMPGDKGTLSALADLGIEVHDLDQQVVESVALPLLMEQMHPTQHGVKPYILKQLALLSSNCRECLLLDADNMPVRDPTFLFTDPDFLRTGLLLWPDFWHMRAGPATVRSIFGLSESWDEADLGDTRTVESGQMVVDKRRAWNTLMLSIYMQMQTEFFDNQMRALHHLGGGGDKQTFLIGCLATNSTCHMVAHPVASAGRIINTAFCGRAMVQHDSDGRILFVHANLDKKKFLARVAQFNEWTEDLRINDVVRQPQVEGGPEVAFVHEPACLGGEYVVQVSGDYREVSLQDEAGFDFEQRRFAFIRQWQSLQEENQRQDEQWMRSQ